MIFRGVNLFGAYRTNSDISQIIFEKFDGSFFTKQIFIKFAKI